MFAKKTPAASAKSTAHKVVEKVANAAHCVSKPAQPKHKGHHTHNHHQTGTTPVTHPVKDAVKTVKKAVGMK
ncbi:hypothetical protein MKW92_049318 [Papaver armeniacum]|nr:hypothetical protein MKW92_049318 [Papaver armeniacum]